MKPRFCSFSVLACVAFVAVVVSHCNEKSNPVSAGVPAIVGTWSLTTVTMKSTTVSAGTTTLTSVAVYNGDYTCRVITNNYVVSPATSDTATGRWKTSGDELIITSPGSASPDTSTYSIAGNVLTITAQAVDSVEAATPMTMVFRRE